MACPKLSHHLMKNFKDLNNDKKEHVQKYVYHFRDYHLMEYEYIPFLFSFFYCLNQNDQFLLGKQHQIPFQRKNEH